MLARKLPNNPRVLSISSSLRKGPSPTRFGTPFHRHYHEQQTSSSSFRSNYSWINNKTNWVIVAGSVLAVSFIGLKSKSINAESSTNLKPIANSNNNKIFDAEEIKKHSTPDSIWVVIGTDVWDVTDFVAMHPGGPGMILQNGGKNITNIFNDLHQPAVLKEALSPEKKIGKVDENTLSQLEVARDPADIEAEENRKSLPDVNDVFNLHMFEQMAKEIFNEGKPWGYFSSFADDGYAYEGNKNSFNLLRFIPRILVPVDKCDTKAPLATGETFDLPIYIAPTGLARMAHPGAEANLVQAAQKAHIPYCVSSGSSLSFDDVLDERDRILKETGQRPSVWFQLYVRSDRKETEKRLKEYVRRGTDVIMFTVDAPVVGKREGDSAVHKRGGAPAGDVTRILDANLTWNDISWIKGIAPKTPLFLKGVQSAEDAYQAYKLGADGVVLSNHGGRQLDHAPPALATLLHIRQHHPELINNDKFEIYMDGGVRRGTDVIKALCLGAKGIGIGRGFIYSNATYGCDGVVRATEILKEEIETGMRLLGARSVKELRPEMIEVLPGLVGQAPPNCDSSKR